jgi:hypothetical protein
MNLFAYHHNPATPASFFADIPPLVWTTMYAASRTGVVEEVHRNEVDARTQAACGLSLTLLALVDVTRVRPHMPIWCAGCWPGGRCEICGSPSGQHSECLRCNSASLNIDDAYRRAA